MPTTALGPSDSDFDYQTYPFYLLSRASGRYNAAMEAALKPLDLDQARWRILLVLAQHEALGTQEIARKVVYKLSTTTRMVQRLERDGYVITRQSDADGRIRNVAITEAGHRVVDQSRPLAQSFYAAAFDGISNTELQAFSKVLAAIDTKLR
ncbi:MAG: MarR family transcriptional regulator [Pseudomonadota bacterium]